MSDERIRELHRRAAESADVEARLELARWWHRLGCPGRDPRQDPRKGDRITWGSTYRNSDPPVSGVHSCEVEVRELDPEFVFYPRSERLGLVTVQRVCKRDPTRTKGLFMTRAWRKHPPGSGKREPRYTWVGGWAALEVVTAHAGWLWEEAS